MSPSPHNAKKNKDAQSEGPNYTSSENMIIQEYPADKWNNEVQRSQDGTCLAYAKLSLHLNEGIRDGTTKRAR